MLILMWIPKGAALIRGWRLFESRCLLEKIRYLNGFLEKHLLFSIANYLLVVIKLEINLVVLISQTFFLNNGLLLEMLRFILVGLFVKHLVYWMHLLGIFLPYIYFSNLSVDTNLEKFFKTITISFYVF